MTIANLSHTHNFLQEFTVDNEVIVTNHSETVRKLHAWRADFKRILKRIVSITYELDILWDPGIDLVSVERIRLFLLHARF